mmetsp:Transcript_83482/g.232916  ORF Transcript_83482/g.232916 Transcript_83482/m.232916 type:complete len:213 (+) Transcript_83482:419-1057(+)
MRSIACHVDLWRQRDAIDQQHEVVDHKPHKESSEREPLQRPQAHLAHEAPINAEDSAAKERYYGQRQLVDRLNLAFLPEVELVLEPTDDARIPNPKGCPVRGRVPHRAPGGGDFAGELLVAVRWFHSKRDVGRWHVQKAVRAARKPLSQHLQQCGPVNGARLAPRMQASRSLRGSTRTTCQHREAAEDSRRHAGGTTWPVKCVAEHDGEGRV